MGGLKEHQFCESDEFFREYTGPLSNETHLYYLKSEADKVIAYHKYKRCLAMARWCDSEANYLYDSSKVLQCWRYGHYISWFNKWSKLAEKFKEAK